MCGWSDINECMNGEYANEYYDLIVKYEREGIIEKCYNDLWGEDFEDLSGFKKIFDWLKVIS